MGLQVEIPNRFDPNSNISTYWYVSHVSIRFCDSPTGSLHFHIHMSRAARDAGGLPVDSRVYDVSPSAIEQMRQLDQSVVKLGYIWAKANVDELAGAIDILEPGQ